MKRRTDLDATRGLMLVLMSLTHLPTRLSDPTGQPFGFVSAAEGFVMLSAYMAGLVYTERALKDGVPAMRRAFLLRALKIYGCQAALLFFLFSFVALFGLTIDRPEIKGLMSWYLQHPLAAFLGGLALLYNPPLLDILPLYIVLMLASPLLLAHGLQRGWAGLMAVSLLLWFAAQFGAGAWLYQAIAAASHLPIPLDQTGSFVPLAWQFLWLLGLWMGANEAQAPDAVTVLPRGLLLAALIYGICGLVWRHAIGQAPFGGNATLNLLWDKWHLGPLRIFNFLALLLLAMHYGPKLLGRLPRLRWLEVMGSASLPVFCAQLVLVLLALLAFGTPIEERPLRIDAAIVLLSFAALYGVALISQHIDRYAAAFKQRRAARRERRRLRLSARALR